MILYFSGTGNSEYVAKRIGEGVDDSTLNLFEKIRNHDYAPLHSDTPWVVVAPTYSWRIPHIVHDWLEKTPLNGNKDIYFVMTCGGNIGNAGLYLKKLCTSKSLTYQGCAPVVMPENYIALFSTPTPDEAKEIICKAQTNIDQLIGLLRQKRPIPEREITVMDKMYSGPVNHVFYPLFVHAKKFYATDACVSCGQCVKLCPTKNVRLDNGKPVWGTQCTHCMACICRCPKEAIEYGKHSRGLPRYYLPTALMKDSSKGDN